MNKNKKKCILCSVNYYNGHEDGHKKVCKGIHWAQKWSTEFKKWFHYAVDLNY